MKMKNYKWQTVRLHCTSEVPDTRYNTNLWYCLNIPYLTAINRMTSLLLATFFLARNSSCLNKVIEAGRVSIRWKTFWIEFQEICCSEKPFSLTWVWIPSQWGFSESSECHWYINCLISKFSIGFQVKPICGVYFKLNEPAGWNSQVTNLTVMIAHWLCGCIRVRSMMQWTQMGGIK